MVRISDETIHIENLSVSGVIGVYPEERVRRQPLIFTLSLTRGFAEAAAHDDVLRTLDYAEVCREIQAFVEAHAFKLLETLIHRLAVHLGERFEFERLTLHIRKPEAIQDADAAAVSLTLDRTDTRRP
jgi:FolB domain-containing protein